MHIPFPMRAAVLAAALAAAGSAHAFAPSDTLDGWSVTGDALAQAGAITLTTAWLGDGDPDTPFNLSGVAAADIAAVEAAAGVAAYALDLASPDFAFEGSVIAQRFDVAPGQRLGFTWSFGGAEDLFEDHAFAVVNGQLFTLASRSSAPAGPQAFSLALAAGPVWLALGVVDTGDALGVSTLSVSGLQVSPVPEPAPAALLLAGLALLQWRRRSGRAA